MLGFQLPARLLMPLAAAAMASLVGIFMVAVGSPLEEMATITPSEGSGAMMAMVLTAMANIAARRPPVVVAGMRGLRAEGQDAVSKDHKEALSKE